MKTRLTCFGGSMPLVEAGSKEQRLLERIFEDWAYTHHVFVVGSFLLFVGTLSLLPAVIIATHLMLALVSARQLPIKN